MNHNRLLDKIWYYGVQGSLFSWIQSYLTNRSYAVRVRGGCFDFLIAPSGVPQGSCIGPILFSLFINDLSSLIKFSQVLFYADDTKIIRAINSPLDCTKLQRDIEAFDNWSRANGLPVNIQKCAVMTFTRSESSIRFHYQLAGSDLQLVSSAKDIGVIFNSDFSFKYQVDAVYSRAFRTLGFIKRTTFDFRHVSSMLYLYKSLVLP